MVGLSQAGKPREMFQITGGGFVCTGPDDESVMEMMDWVRYRIGFYGSTKAYWPVFEQHDLLDLGEELNHLSKNDGWGEMASRISDDVVRQFAAVGRHDEIVAAIEDRFGGLTDAIGASASPEIPADLPQDVIQDIQSIPTLYRAQPVSAV
jgi:hypothetical protein